MAATTTTDDAQFVYDEVPVSAKVHSTGAATPEELVRMAGKIWKEVKAERISLNDHRRLDEQLARLQKEYRDFATSFPVVLRWQVQMRKYNSVAFKRYLVKHASVELKTKEDFLRLQAEYLVHMFREENPHSGNHLVRRYRDNIVKQLLDEDKQFEQVQKQVDLEVAEMDKANDTERRTQLYNLLRQRQKESAAAAIEAPTTADGGGAPTATTADPADGGEAPSHP